MRICDIENCDRKHMAKGLCELHYRRLEIHGSTDKPKRIYKIRICNINGCDRKHSAKGLCLNHATLKWQKDNPDKANKKSREWKKSNKEKIQESSRIYRKNNKEKIQEYGKEYRKINKEKCNIKVREWAKKYPEKRKIHRKKWNKANPDKMLEIHKRHLKKIGSIFNMTSREYGYALETWARAVKKRDKQCKICESKEKLVSHHILYKYKYPLKSLEVYNGVTLCIFCHYDYHNLNGWR